MKRGVHQAVHADWIKATFLDTHDALLPKPPIFQGDKGPIGDKRPIEENEPQPDSSGDELPPLIPIYSSDKEGD